MGCQLPRYAKCCYCIPLKIGVLLIGYFSIFASCLALAAASWSIYQVSVYVRDSQLRRPTPEHTPEDMAKAATGLYVSFAYYLIVFLYNLIINTLLVVGVHKNNTRLMRMYFNATCFLVILGSVLVVLTGVFVGILATVSLLKWCFTLLICMIIVRSYYLQLEEKEKQPVIEMQPYMPVQQAPTDV